MTQLLLRLLH
jgi:hypothetical protein